MKTKSTNFFCISYLLEKKKLLFSCIAALFFTLISTNILNRLIYRYSTSIYEVMLVDKDSFYSKEAIISIELMLLLFLTLNFIIGGLLIRKFKSFVLIYLLFTLASAIQAYFFVEVDIIRGL